MSTEPTPLQPSGEIQQVLGGNKNQAIGEMSGGTAFSTVEGSVSIIYNYYYHKEPVDSESVESTDTANDENLPCPYRGLFHFSPNDAPYFFGREKFIKELFAATQTRNFIPVLGASGSGKSSVVLAGLVPKLQKEGNWLFTHFRPGSDPFHTLAKALVPLYEPDKNSTEQMRQARQLAEYFVNGDLPLQDVFSQIERNYPNHRVLLIADQFEEIYTLCADQKIRHSFLDTLLTSFQSSPSPSQYNHVLVATIRADFLGKALSYPQLGDLLQNADIKIRSMNHEELTEVIEKPAAKLGVSFEGGLVQRILDDVDSEPGNLPLLEFALTELWKRRRGKQLTHAAYEDIGEVKGALARHADENYRKLSRTEQEQVRRIFIQLVRPGEGTEDTRRLATKAELGEDKWSLVQKLAARDARLVVTSRNAVEQETVEVVHEALIRNWGELRQWMNTDRSFRAWQEQVRFSMRQWQQMQRDEGALLRGEVLADAEKKLKLRRDDLAQGEQDFIRTSIALRDREKKQRQRTKLFTVSGLTSIAVISLLFGSVSWWRLDVNEKNANLINHNTNVKGFWLSNTRQLQALKESIKLGKKLQKESKATPETRMWVVALLREIVYNIKERNSLEKHSFSVNSVVFSPDGKIIATASKDNTVKLWNLQGQEIKTLKGHDSDVTSVAFSPDGNTIASASEDITVKLWNIQGQEIKTLKGHDSDVTSVAFSPDGKIIATASKDNTVKLWNIQGQEIKTLKGHGARVDSNGLTYSGVTSVAFSPDGNTIATASEDSTVKLWNLQGQEIKTLKGHSVTFSPNGKTIATVSDDSTVKLWNLQGQEIKTLKGHSVTFSPDGNTIATASKDSTVKLWNLQGQEIKTLKGHSVTFSPDSNTIATVSDVSDDSTVKLWNLQGQEIRTLSGHANSIKSVAFSPDSNTIATASWDSTVKLWNLQRQEVKTLSNDDSGVISVAFSPDGNTIASASLDKTVKLWNLQGQEIKTFGEGGHTIISVAFSPDGNTIATDSEDSTVQLWNLQGQEIKTLTGHSERVNSVAFSPDGNTIASASLDKTVKLWNLQGQEIKTLKGHDSGVISVAFSPDANTIASASLDKTVKLWNLQGQEIKILSNDDSGVTSVAFSPDGNTIATASWDSTVKLWNLQGQEIKTLSGHSATVNSVAFSPDGNTIASASRDRTVKLWNLQGQEIKTLSGHRDSVASVAFSPDGNTIATASSDSTVKLWNFDLDDLLVRGCNWVRDYLKYNPNVSDDERRLCDDIGSGK